MASLQDGVVRDASTTTISIESAEVHKHVPDECVYDYLERREMPAAEWVEVESNPAQRDTAWHAEMAMSGHLAVFEPVHRMVNAVYVEEAQLLYKLDGHCRGYLLANKRLRFEGNMMVDVWKCPTVQDAINLYKRFDNRGAVKTSADDIQSLYRLVGLQLKSKLLRPGTAMQQVLAQHYALSNGSRRFQKLTSDGLLEEMKLIVDEMAALDAIDLPKRLIITPDWITMALLALRKDEVNATKFLQAIKVKDGYTNGDAMSVVATVYGYPDSPQYAALNDEKGRTRAEKALTYMAVFGNAFEAFVKHGPDHMFERYPTNTRIVARFNAFRAN